VNRRVILYAVMALTTAVLVNAPEPVTGQAVDDRYAKQKTVFYSDKVLHDALTEIAQMQEPELRAFTRYLAECNDEEDPDVSKHACTAALTNYEIEFGSGYTLTDNRPLDTLIRARGTLAGRLPFERARDREVLSTDPKELANLHKKFAIVISALEGAAHDRFRGLKSVQK